MNGGALSVFLAIPCFILIIGKNPKTFDKKILKFIDLLGRETKVKKNEPLFYIYDDGSVEKKIIIE